MSMGREPIRMLCPGCVCRASKIVAPSCPICAGRGRLTLGRGWLWQQPPAVIATAVIFALELQASNDLRRRVNRGESLLGLARDGQTALIAKMVRKGALAEEPDQEGMPTQMPVGRAETHRRARALSESITGLPYDEGTAGILGAPPVHYEPGITGGIGALPSISLVGYVACLAQVADPLDPLAVHPIDMRAAEHAGKVLGTAIVQST